MKDLNEILRIIRTALGYVALLLAVTALAKFFGMNVPLNGDVQTIALVAIACKMA